jgi:3-hydroxybutyryl-CoA dehydrogenase
VENEKNKSVRRSVRTVGIVGGGTTGSQYVQICAQAGYRVVLVEVAEEALRLGLELIDRRLSQGVANGQIAENERRDVLNRICGSTKFQDFASCDFIIEAVPEKMDLKKQVFVQLDSICDPDVILATNTSVLSIIDIAKATKRADLVIGVHGAPLVFPGLEVIKSLLTSDETVAVAMDFVKSLGRDGFLVKDAPGFLMNRLLTPLFMDMVRMVETGYLTAPEIDYAFTKGGGWPVGPFHMLDEAGLDTMLLATDALHEDLKDQRFVAPVLLRKMVAAGWLGVKTKKGFYEYP